MTEVTVLSPEEREQFNRTGYVRVREAFDPAAARAMQKFMWAQMEALHGVRCDDRATWTQPWPGSGLNKTVKDNVYKPITGPRLCAAIDQLLEAGAWKVPDTWGGFLVSFPRVPMCSWTVAADGWHWDGDAFGHMNGLNGLFIFTFYSSVQPQGGGTLAVAGSHRLLDRMLRTLGPDERPKHGSLVRLFAQSHPWLAELTGGSPDGTDRIARFLDAATDVDGVPAQVVEMTGEPGDAILCHPNIFHTTSMNCAERPRFMRVKGLGRTGGEPG